LRNALGPSCPTNEFTLAGVSDFLEGRDHWTKDRLKEKLNDRESIVYCELILLEIIQGFRKRQEREEIEQTFSSFICAPHWRSATLLAAEIYQALQRKGKRIRSLVAA
jgi:predicted nucleic acid-binding protein